MSRGTFRVVLFGILLAAALARVGYVLALPLTDPAWNDPGLDGSYYIQWGRAISGDGEAPGGAYYLAPLYPYLLAALFRTAGENLLVVYLLQQAALLGAAALLGVVAYRAAGAGAALATIWLALLYHPALFFAAKPVGETVGLLLVAGALALAGRPAPSSTAAAGLLAALGALARPNLLLVPILWAAWDLFERKWRHALIAAGAIAVVLLPVAVRNLRASGHGVPISSNGGITFFHGNGPGATGAFTLPRGFTGNVERQREEATALASLNAGVTLDPVGADGWWGAQALRTRLADPFGTVRLIGWRLLLLLDNAEHGLDYAPRLDTNPWRHAAPVSFALLLGLAVSGLAIAGPRGSGGRHLWTALAACAAAPVVFYAASRYRLPAAFLLCVPAGTGLVELLRAAKAGRLDRRRAVGLLAGGAALALSLIVPSGELVRAAEGGALANRAAVLMGAGDLGGAERTARTGIERDPLGVAARFQLGAVLEKQGRLGEAEEVYRKLLEVEPGHAGAAANLARLLVARSDPGGAVPVLEAALGSNPLDGTCWNNLVVALALSGRRDDAIAAWHEARRRGVLVEDALLEAIGGGTAERNEAPMNGETKR